MAPPPEPTAGVSQNVRQQANAALRTLATVLQNSIAQYDQAVKRSAELTALASAVNPAPPVSHMFKTEPGQPPRLVLLRNGAPPPGETAAVTYTPFAAALAQRNEHLIQNATRCLDDPATSAD